MKLYCILYCIAALGTAATAQSDNQGVCPGERLDTLTDDFINGLFNYNKNVPEVGNKTSLLQGCQDTLQCAAGLETNPNGTYWVVYDECSLTPRSSIPGRHVLTRLKGSCMEVPGEVVRELISCAPWPKCVRARALPLTRSAALPPWTTGYRTWATTARARIMAISRAEGTT